MIYIIQRTDGQYVTRPGSLHSYTKKLQYAQTWRTRELAEAHLCPENERVLTLEQAMEVQL